jgi:hypothetical protein
LVSHVVSAPEQRRERADGVHAEDGGEHHEEIIARRE